MGSRRLQLIHDTDIVYDVESLEGEHCSALGIHECSVERVANADEWDGGVVLDVSGNLLALCFSKRDLEHTLPLLGE